MYVINRKKGFTLIELLIVIAIIGVLAVALLPTILNAPAKGRDAARQSHIKTAMNAIEAAALEIGVYPDINVGFCINELDSSRRMVINGNPVDLTKFFSGGQVPQDPSGKTAMDCAGIRYCPMTSEGHYFLITAMERPENANCSLDIFPTTPCRLPMGGLSISPQTSCGARGCCYVLVR